MNTATLITVGVALPLLIAGCGAQSSPPMSSTPIAAVQRKMVLANGKFAPTSAKISSGQKLTFVFDGMGSDHIEIFTNGHKVAQSPLLNHGGAWTYAFKNPGLYIVEPEAMTYIHASISVQ